MAAKRFITLVPGGGRCRSQDHLGFRRPLFALDFKAFSIVRGCSFTETLPHPARQFARSKFRLRLEQLPEMVADLRRQLVGIFRARLGRQQSLQPAS